MTPAESLKDNVKSAVFQAALIASDLPPAGREKIADVLSLLGILSPNERQAARIMHNYASGNTTLLETAGIARRAAGNYTRQVLEVAAVFKMADHPGEIRWPPFTEPTTLTKEQEHFFQTGGILYTVHGGNPLAAANSVIRIIRKSNPESSPKIVVLIEKQPERIQKGLEKICKHLGITPVIAEEAGVKSLQNLQFDFLLWHGDRRGNANIEVPVCGKTALMSKWIAHFSQKSEKPILPGITVCSIVNRLRTYQLVLGEIIDPKEVLCLDKRVAIERQTAAIARQTEKLLLVDLSAPYLFSPFWKSGQ